MSAWLILVPVLLPVAAGIALLLLPRIGEKNRRIFLEATVCTASLFTWLLILTGPRQVITLYRFIGVFSIDFAIDPMTCLFAGMVSVMWPLVMLYAFAYMEHDKWKNTFFAFYVMTYGITLGVAFSASILTLYVFFEMLTLVTIPLVSHYKNHESMWAARSYAAYLIGGAGLAFAAVILVNIYGNGGIFRYGGSMTVACDPGLLRIVYVLGFFGFGCKAAVFPLYAWLPRASVAPTPVTALLHAVAVVNSGVFAVTRLTWYSIGTEGIAGTWAQYLPETAAAFTLVFAACMALKERHFKRRLAYSTVSNLSYMLFGIALMTPAGLTGGLLHMLFHGIMKMSLFLCAGAFMHVTGCSYIYEINGAGRRMPRTFGFYTISALSLTGIPLLCGFVSKWQLLMAGMQEGSVWSVAGVFCLIVSAFLCAMYTLSVSVRAFFPQRSKDLYQTRTQIGEPPVLMLIPIGLFTAACIVFGIWPAPVVNFLSHLAG